MQTEIEKVVPIIECRHCRKNREIQESGLNGNSSTVLRGVYWNIIHDPNPHGGYVAIATTICNTLVSDVEQNQHVTDIDHVHPAAWSELFLLFVKLKKEANAIGSKINLECLEHTGKAKDHLQIHFVPRFPKPPRSH